MKRQNISSGAKWEDIVGYSRAVKVGNTIEISGTTAIVDGNIVGVNNFYEQTKCILQKIEETLIKSGASMKDVVRTRMFVTDISHWEEIGRAHAEFFKEIKPATSMVEIKALIDEFLLVEIEATAIITTV
ncbi:RidA family protein [Solitalea canadensis]|uniref:Putative translation initiation inhibitor, yjgF family n=1 Tax=Solitalea canadensis (strain ATCC 29591 / DSM 3403 / JCM 21819 / LMG 8368 / NBRC 15130 / NCIMB 12057 / USAM 9D) TaxID=929556 RepID=H8KKY6_SOLCM|nr:RidA family protein [Solitalea canadensis]AFD08803.1 putative translation initiation inhibitor, yjgF family [Solitalea canadensis DSM 3403]